MLWKAIFQDGTTICSINAQGAEVLFREVLNKEKTVELLEFRVEYLGKNYSVSMLDGSFTIGIDDDAIKLFTMEVGVANPADFKYRLIYYQRHIQYFGTAMDSVGGGLAHIGIGWQATDKDGVNIKRVLKLHPLSTSAIFELESKG